MHDSSGFPSFLSSFWAYLLLLQLSSMALLYFKLLCITKINVYYQTNFDKLLVSSLLYYPSLSIPPTPPISNLKNFSKLSSLWVGHQSWGTLIQTKIKLPPHLFPKPFAFKITLECLKTRLENCYSVFLFSQRITSPPKLGSHLLWGKTESSRTTNCPPPFF